MALKVQVFCFLVVFMCILDIFHDEFWIVFSDWF